MSFSINDHIYMARAIQLAERGLYTTDPNPCVGCVIVKDDVIVGEGAHLRAGEAHAEVNALAQAGERAEAATAYVSLEPCSHFGRTPPCSQALIKAGVTRVVSAMQDPNPQVAGNGIQQLLNAGIQAEVGLLEAEAKQLNLGYIQRMRSGRPYIRNKLAMSLDGRTALASGESKWITDAAARQDVQRWRARSSAIMTGIGTVLADDPRMTVRLEQDVVMPLRVVIDSNLSMPLDAQILKQEGETCILTCSDDEDTQQQLRDAGAHVQQLAAHNGSVDLHAAIDYLGERGINDVLLETGATLSGAMLQAGLIDELIIYIAPLLLGDTARGLYHLLGINEMSQRIELDIRDISAVGKDWRVRAIPVMKEQA